MSDRDWDQEFAPYVPDYNNPTQEMIDSIEGPLRSDAEVYETEYLIRRMYDHLGLDLEEEK